MVSMPHVSLVLPEPVIITMISQRDTYYYVNPSSNKGTNMAFCVNNFVVLLRSNLQSLQSIQSHLKTLKGIFPLQQWESILGLLQLDLSPENLVLNIHSVFSVGGDGRLGTHKGLNITRES